MTENNGIEKDVWDGRRWIQNLSMFSTDGATVWKTSTIDKMVAVFCKTQIYYFIDRHANVRRINQKEKIYERVFKT